MNKDKVLLPIRTPLITSYAIYTNKLSILACYPETVPWVLSNFIQIRCNKELRIYFYDSVVVESPWSKSYRIPRDLLPTEHIAEQLVAYIAQGYYVFFMVDEFYIPNTNAYQQFSRIHELFVYGYDLEEQTFNVAGNLIDGKYMSTTCTFEEMDLAHRHMDPTVDDWVDGFILYKYYGERKFDFDVELVKILLRDYLTSNNMYKNHIGSMTSNRSSITDKDEWDFGVSVYDRLIEGMIRYGETNTWNLALDIRQYHTLHDHKQCMKARIDFMIKEGMLPQNKNYMERYEVVVSGVLVMRNMVLKHRYKKDENIVQNLIRRLQETKKNEMEIVEEILLDLN